MKRYLILLVAVTSFGQVVEFGRDTKTLTLAYGGPTIVHFPMEVKTISGHPRFTIAPADEQQANYAILSITPRFTRGADDVTFILSDLSVLHAKLVIVRKPIPEKTDSFYEVQTKDHQIDKMKDSPPSSDERISELALLRAIVNGRRPRGFRLNRVSQDINLGIAGVECHLTETYTSSELYGYVFELKNTSDKSVHINLSKLSFEAETTAVLSQIDRETLSKAGMENSHTFLRVISKTDSVNDLLPKAPIEDVGGTHG